MSSSIEWCVLTCVDCATPFAVTHEFEARFRKTGKPFHCPLGHSQVWKVGQTEDQRTITKLRAQLDRLQAKMEEMEGKKRKGLGDNIFGSSTSSVDKPETKEEKPL